MIEPASNPLVIYNSRVRWVAVLNLAFAAIGIYLGLRFLEGGVRISLVVFLSLFSLFWVRDVVFGFPLKLVSNGVTLQWQDGKKSGSVLVKGIRRISVGVEKSKPKQDIPVAWTYITLHMANGEEQALPPNLANGLRARNWLRMRKLVEHIRAISPVSIVSLNDPSRNIEGVKPEIFTPTNAGTGG